MKPRLNASTISAIVIVILPALLSTALAQSHRQIHFQEGRPLLGELRQSDSVLTVRSGSESAPMQIGPPSGMSLVEYLTRLSDVVLLIQVQNRVGALTPSGDWITTDVTALVTDILKNTSGLSIAASILFTEDGGEFVHGKQRIVGLVPWAAPIKVGSTYLAFGKVREGKITIGTLAMYEHVGGKLIGRNVEQHLAVRSLPYQSTIADVKKSASLPTLTRPRGR